MLCFKHTSKMSLYVMYKKLGYCSLKKKTYIFIELKRKVSMFHQNMQHIYEQILMEYIKLCLNKTTNMLSLKKTATFLQLLHLMLR